VGAWRRLPAPLRRTGDAIALRAPRRYQRAVSTLVAADPVDRLIEMSGRLGGGLRESLFHGPLEGKVGAGAIDAVRAAVGDIPDDPLPATLHIDAQVSLSDLLLHYFDRTSMAHSIEVRVPFLDHHVVEYCAQIPRDLKVRRLQTKYLLKQAATGIVPDRIIHKRKLGFLRGSTETWLQAQLRDAVPDLLFGDDVRCAEFINPQMLRRLGIAHRDGTDTSNVHLLTGIVMLETWLRDYLPRAASQSPPPPQRLEIAA
jgi:asparagine synthase (glutamine-hydrolysing)